MLQVETLQYNTCLVALPALCIEGIWFYRYVYLTRKDNDLKQSEEIFSFMKTSGMILFFYDKNSFACWLW